MLRKWSVPALLALFLAVPTVAHATPTDNYYVWQIWAYVNTYRDLNTGDVVVTFEDSGGTQITNFPNGAGVNQCPNNPGLQIAQNHPLFDRLSKTILTGGLARRNMKVAYEATNGACYIKMITVEM